MRVLAARFELVVVAKLSFFSWSRRSCSAALRLFLKKKRASASAAPIRQMIPKASPAFPPALIPPEELESEVDVEEALAAETVEDVLDVAASVDDEDVDEAKVAEPVAASRATELPTEVEGLRISVGVLLDVAAESELTAAAEVVLLLARAVVVDVVSASVVDEAATPTVVYPPMAPAKVLEAVT